MSGTARQNAYTIGSVVRGTVTTGNNGTFSHTVAAGSNLALLVLIGTHQGTISAVTWNGVSLTKIDSGRSSLNECGDAWILINPTPATGNVVVTRSGGSWHGVVAVNLSNVLQSVPTNKAIANGESSVASVSITPANPYNLVVAAVGTEAAITVSAGTLLGEVTGQPYERMSSSYVEATDVSSKTMSFNIAAGKRWGIVAVSIEPAIVTETQKRSQTFLRTASGTRITPAI